MGNSFFDFSFSSSVGLSGGILCVWDPNSFVKDNATISDYFVAVRGTWLSTATKVMFVSIYAPQDISEKKSLWEYITHIIDTWDGECIILGDFNEVRSKQERFGTIFNETAANAFNHFISTAGLIDLPLEGYSFTWAIKSAKKMSKLDRFLISEGLLLKFPSLSAICLDRHLSDHRPIIMSEVVTDYGPSPFRAWSESKEENWIDEPCKVKNEFLMRFSNRFESPSGPCIDIDCHLFKKLSSEQVDDLECECFDFVRWDFLDIILRNFGFGIKWRGWIQGCLSSAMGSILVNGSPTAEFKFHKGLKQGDPLSPYLFILVMESLHLSFNNIINADLFKGIRFDDSLTLSHLFYADDAVFIGKWDRANILTIVRMLKCFFLASGLQINILKSKLMGIGVSNEEVLVAANIIGCSTFSTPFSYLGVKVGMSPSRRKAWDEIIAPLGVLRDLESLRRKFFNGADINEKRFSMISWNKILVLNNKELGDASLWNRLIAVLYGNRSPFVHTGSVSSLSPWNCILKELNSLSAKDKTIDASFVASFAQRVTPVEGVGEMVKDKEKGTSGHVIDKMRALLIQHGCEVALEVLPADMEAEAKAELNKKAHSAVILCLDEFNKIIIDLANIKVKFKDEDLALLLLAYLSTLYEHFVETLLYDREALTLKDVMATLNSKKIKERSKVKGDKGKELYARGRTKRKDSHQSRENSRSKSRGERLKCYICQYKDHSKRNYLKNNHKKSTCYIKKDDQPSFSGSIYDGSEVMMVMTAEDFLDWIMDSGGSARSKAFSIWKTFGGNTRDLGSFEEETDKTTNLHQHLLRLCSQRLETTSQITRDSVTTLTKTASQESTTA
ncbi:RNA-directed DNA polymerase, eukaryota, partial [Tanacetum coccineum]